MPDGPARLQPAWGRVGAMAGPVGALAHPAPQRLAVLQHGRLPADGDRGMRCLQWVAGSTARCLAADV